jgi:5-methylcytosine-specific restriction endonuclease McrA
MSDNPSMPMFWAEFFSDTEHLPEDAAKAYLFLLGHAWIRGARLPDDDLALARMSRVGPRKWTAIKSIVMGLWYKDELGFWTRDDLQKRWRRACARPPFEEWILTKAAILRRDNFSCVYCGSSERLECDHVVPISRGGSNDQANLACACFNCNRSKGAKLVEEWRP